MMKNIQVAIIGSTVVDIIINIPHLPHSQEDVNVTKQQLSLGGYAYNASQMLSHFQVPYLLFSPIGSGMYGNYVKTELDKRHIHRVLPSIEEENGCCYCFVEEGGERTFISHHGAEYRFKKQWFSLLEEYPIDTVYICGLEIEEESGTYIIEYLEEHPNIQIYFAPGPRIHHIAQDKLQRLFRLSPILHLNEEEALMFTKVNTLAHAAASLYQLTKQTLIITLGKQGSYIYTKHEQRTVPTKEVLQVDTIGAGDAHIGTIIACIKNGDTLGQAVQKANIVATAIVGKEGAILDYEDFKKLCLLP